MSYTLFYILVETVYSNRMYITVQLIYFVLLSDMLAVVIEAQSSLVFLRDLLMVSFVYQFIEDKMVIPRRIAGGEGC